MSMGFRPFGRTGLMVSPFTMGTMEFGSRKTHHAFKFVGK